MILGVNHIALSVPDLERAIAFYCGELGLRVVARSEWKPGTPMSDTAAKITGIQGTGAVAAHLRSANLLLELFQFTDGDPQPQAPARRIIDHGITHICLAVTDLDAEYARLAARGMQFLGDPVRIAPGLRSVYGRDPFGNVIELEEARGRVDATESALTTVKRRLSTLALGVAFLLLFAAFWLWQTPGVWRSPMTAAEIDAYAAAIERHAVVPAADKAAFIARIREWAAGDDGRPVLLLNLMRYRETLAELPPGTGFNGTPHEANAYYESQVAPLALKRGEYPLIGGDTQARSLIGSGLDTVAWNRVVIMRAPSRRAFIEFMADPAYGPAIPYKLAAEDVVLIPIDAQMLVPDLRWIAGAGLAILYLLILWRGAVRAGAGAIRRGAEHA